MSVPVTSNSPSGIMMPQPDRVRSSAMEAATAAQTDSVLAESVKAFVTTEKNSFPRQTALFHTWVRSG